MPLSSKYTRILAWLLDLIFPRSCLGCGKDGTYLCQDCQASLPVLSGANCHFCGRRSPSGYACQKCRDKFRSPVSGILVASDWNNLLLRQVIYECKYRFVKELAGPLSEIMIIFLRTAKPDSWQIGKPANRETNELLLIPVPLHKKRSAWRGFNQSELLAQKISEKINATASNDILIRARHALPQREITDMKSRAANIKNAFALSPKISSADIDFLKNKIIILVDDICTTGSTLQDCARALAPLKPKEIWGLVIARG